MIDPLQAAPAVVALLFGLVVGSFLTVVVHRVPRHESLVAPRSRCPGCGQMVRPRDNIPVVSWVLLRGKCRDCGTRISVRYPLTELANGLLWAAAALRFPDDLFLVVVFACFFSVLVAVSLIDLERKIIPNAIVYPSLAVFAVAVGIGALAGGRLDAVGALLGFAGYGGLLLVVALLVPKGMGMGDVKLVALIGLVLGGLSLDLVVVAAMLGFLVGGVGGVFSLLVSRDGKSTIPFGPFLATGAVLSAFFGAQIASWYLDLLR